MKKEIAKKIVSETEQGYDAIAEKFSQTRKHFWRELEFIKEYTHVGDTVFDFGCGNGRLLEVIGKENIRYVGADVSGKLLEKAKNMYTGEHISFQKISPSQESLPFENEFFNTMYSIAVFHHLPSNDLRKKIAKELYRVTKKDGYVIITVWNLCQKKYIKNILKNWKDKIFAILIRMSPIRSRGLRRDSGVKNLDWNDCYIPFTDNSGKKIQRFHHAFTKSELKNLFSSVGFHIEKCKIVAGRNIVLVGRK